MSFWPAATLVIGLASGLGSMTVHLIPAAERFEVPPAAADVDEASVSWVSPGAFCLGIAAGIFALSVGAVDEVKQFLNIVEHAPDGSDTRRRRR
jgi:hypothetical protein